MNIETYLNYYIFKNNFNRCYPKKKITSTIHVSKYLLSTKKNYLLIKINSHH